MLLLLSKNIFMFICHIPTTINNFIIIGLAQET